MTVMGTARKSSFFKTLVENEKRSGRESEKYENKSTAAHKNAPVGTPKSAAELTSCILLSKKRYAAEKPIIRRANESQTCPTAGGNIIILP